MRPVKIAPEIKHKGVISTRAAAPPDSGSSANSNGHVVADFDPDTANNERGATTRRARLDGNVARRHLPGSGFIWDAELPGFGLRYYATGRKVWIVQFRRRGTVTRSTLGDVRSVDAGHARGCARAILAKAKLAGLPVRPSPSSGTSLRFAAYVDEFWRDYAPHWKPTTQQRSRCAIDSVLLPFFGRKTLPGIDRQDVLSFRESRAHRGGSFHSELAVLSAMLGYAEKLGYRTPGSNPCKGVPRYKRTLKERYLSAREYQRLAAVLRASAREMPRSVGIIWLLLFTGARKSEIETICWEWLTPSYARLPDSKTGTKRLYLNKPANAVLDCIGRTDTGLIFPPGGGKTSSLPRDWRQIRRAAAIPDVRLHDLRHSFASVAITDGVPLLTLGRLLGHVLPETTARYAHLADEVIQDAASRISGSIATAMGISA